MKNFFTMKMMTTLPSCTHSGPVPAHLVGGGDLFLPNSNNCDAIMVRSNGIYNSRKTDSSLVLIAVQPKVKVH